SRRTILDLDYIRTTKNRDLRAAAEASTHSNAELGRQAAEMAIARAGISPSDVGMVIGGGSVPESLTPADAAYIARELGIEAPVFDVNSACTSFLVQVNLLAMMRPEALPDFVLIVVPEAVTRVVDYGDRSAAVIWGDGAAAAVVSTKLAGRAEVLGARMASDPAGADKVVVPRLGYFDQEGRAVQMFAIKKTEIVYRELRDEFATDGRTLHFVGHQANLRMLQNVCERCDIPPERHHANVETRGNTAAASSPSVVSMRWEEWGPTDDVAVVGVGAGLTWAGYLLRFGSAA
ncbi:MAG: 3-oxoacyl-ACP synthase III family protein, partial [Candidatus Binatia bacterium]